MYPVFLSQLFFLNMAWKRFTAYIKKILTSVHLNAYIYTTFCSKCSLYEKTDWIKILNSAFWTFRENSCNTSVPFVFLFTQCNEMQKSHQLHENFACHIARKPQLQWHSWRPIGSGSFVFLHVALMFSRSYYFHSYFKYFLYGFSKTMEIVVY